MDFIVLILEILVDKSHKSYTIALPPMLPMLIGPAGFIPCRADIAFTLCFSCYKYQISGQENRF